MLYNFTKNLFTFLWLSVASFSKSKSHPFSDSTIYLLNKTHKHGAILFIYSILVWLLYSVFSWYVQFYAADFIQIAQMKSLHKFIIVLYIIYISENRSHTRTKRKRSQKSVTQNQILMKRVKPRKFGWKKLKVRFVIMRKPSCLFRVFFCLLQS